MRLQDRLSNRKGNASFFSGKDQMSIPDLMQNHPDGVTIIDFTFGEGENGSYVAFSCAEEPEFFTFGGTVLYDELKKWCDEIGIEEVKSELNADPSLTKFIRKQNKKGKYYFDIV